MQWGLDRKPAGGFHEISFFYIKLNKLTFNQVVMKDRTEIVIGASGKVGKEYLDYLELKGVSTIAVYRTGEGSQFAGYSNLNNVIK